MKENGKLASVVLRVLANSAGSGQPGTAPFALATMEKSLAGGMLGRQAARPFGRKAAHNMGGLEGTSHPSPCMKSTCLLRMAKPPDAVLLDTVYYVTYALSSLLEAVMYTTNIEIQLLSKDTGAYRTT